MKSIKAVLVVGLFVLSFAVVTGVARAEDAMIQKGDAMVQKGDAMMQKGDAMVQKGGAMMQKGDAMMAKGDDMMKADAPATEALNGYCPVCVMHGNLKKGSSNFTTEYKGKIYHFISMDRQKMFLDNPEEFVKDAETKLMELMKK